MELWTDRTPLSFSWLEVVIGSFKFEAMFTKKSLNSFTILTESSVCKSLILIDPIVDCLCEHLPAPTSRKIL